VNHSKQHTAMNPIYANITVTNFLYIYINRISETMPISVIPLNHEIHILAVAHNTPILEERRAHIISMISPENDKLE